MSPKCSICVCARGDIIRESKYIIYTIARQTGARIVRAHPGALYRVSKVRESRGYPRERRKEVPTGNKEEGGGEEEDSGSLSPSLPPAGFESQGEREAAAAARLLTRTRTTRLTFMGIKRNCSSRAGIRLSLCLPVYIYIYIRRAKRNKILGPDVKPLRGKVTNEYYEYVMRLY